MNVDELAELGILLDLAVGVAHGVDWQRMRILPGPTLAAGLSPAAGKCEAGQDSEARHYRPSDRLHVSLLFEATGDVAEARV